MATKRQDTTIDELSNLMEGASKIENKRLRFLFPGRMLTLTQVIAEIRKVYDTEREVLLSAARHQEAIRRRDEVRAATKAAMDSVKKQLIFALGNDPAAVALLGLEPPKPRRKLNMDERLLKQERAKSTRVARGTKSKKAKSKIFGEVTGVEVGVVHAERDEES